MKDTLALTIPYYRGKDFLVRAIDSVLRQRNPSWTLLVSDDGPEEEGIGELVASYRDARIGYRRNGATLGPAGNWNACLDQAPGDLVTIFHADDELLDNYCDVMLQAARDHPDATAYFCDAVIIDGGGRRTFSVPDVVKHFLRPAAPGALVLWGPDAIADLLRGDFIMCPTVCYRRDRLRGRRFDGRWRFVLDLDFFTRLLADGEKLVGIPAQAYAYRRHAGSATAQQTATLERFAEEAELYDQLADLGARRGWAGVVQMGRRKRIIRLNLLYCAVRDVLGLRWGDARRKLAFWRRQLAKTGLVDPLMLLTVVNYLFASFRQ
jgi:glycosyltransferase involved in cell wall biosynthesis